METLEVPIRGMDCAECTRHVQHAIAGLPGVEQVEVFLASEKAVIRLDPLRVALPAIRQAVQRAGYEVAAQGGGAAWNSGAVIIGGTVTGGAETGDAPGNISEASAAPGTDARAIPGRDAQMGSFARRVWTLLAVLFGVILFVVVAGEWLGLFETLTGRVPFPLGLALVGLGGWPVFRKVVAAARQRQVISHTLMTLGVLAALAVGQWATALVVVFFMRVGETVERFTAEGTRRAVKDLAALAPQTARLELDGAERVVPISAVQPGMVVIVRPGEKIPVDGEVTGGQATLDQAAITGEAMPVEAGPGAQVFAATIARLGSLRIRATRVGADSTFGRVVRLVEQAEANRAEVQRFADKFSAYFLPVVSGIALLTLLIRGDPLAAAAVLVVACSCSVALATPIAVLASIGGGARRGLLIKGGKVLEILARADTVLIDKTGTLTLGRPQVTDVLVLDGAGEAEIIRLAAAAERYSEHPLAEAVRSLARQRGISPGEAQDFEALPGRGVRAVVAGERVALGNAQLILGAERLPEAAELEQQGKTLFYLSRDEALAGAIAVADTLRPEVPQALRELRALGIGRIELLTGDNERAAAAIAEGLAGAMNAAGDGAATGEQATIPYRAGLLPEDKIAIVKEYQTQGRTVVMVGDGVNDAPALAQADVGIAMGAAGTDIALEAAHIALMREDWRLVPEALRIARRTMGVVKLNLGFTAAYNLAGLTLAALGLLPPVFAAAAQSLPDLGILANSARLLRPPRSAGSANEISGTPARG